MKWFKHSLLAVMVAVFMAIDIQAATLRSDQVTNSNAVPPTMNPTNIEGGAVRRSRGTYTFTGSEAAADVIEMVNIPYGAIIIRELSTIQWEDMGVTITVDVGDGDDDDRYCSALVMGTANAARVTFEEAVGLGVPYIHNVTGTSTTLNTVDLTLDAATAPTSTQRISMEVVYVTGG